MSVQQFFSEVEAVAQILDGYATRQNAKQDYFKRPTEEEFTAIWQAVELLSRAHGVLLPLMQFEQSKQYLVLNDPQQLTLPLEGVDVGEAEGA